MASSMLLFFLNIDIDLWWKLRFGNKDFYYWLFLIILLTKIFIGRLAWQWYFLLL